MGMTRASAPLQGALVALTLTACGSTVATSGQGLAANGTPLGSGGDGLSAPDPGVAATGDGLTVPGAAGVGAAPGDVSADGGAAEGAGAAEGGGTAQGGGAAVPDQGAAPGGGGATGQPPAAAGGAPLGKREPISVGVLYSADVQEFTGAVGGSSQQINAKRASEVVIASYNKGGGILGHKIEPVFHSISLASSNPEGEQAAACEKFTKDNKVRLVIDAGPFQRPSRRDCLAKAGVINVVTGLGKEQEATFDRQPLLAHPVSLSLERRARATAQGLGSLGYLRSDRDGKALTAANPIKLGVITFDQPDFKNAYLSAMKPAFAKAGKAVDAEFFLSNATPADTARDINAAVLRFAGLGITHVVFFASNGSVPAFFMNGASSQGYEPRYGLTSNDTPQVLPANITDPKGQLHGSVGIGWLPGVDSIDGNKPGTAPSEQAACEKLMRDGGLQGRDANSRTQLALVCDAWSFTRMAFSKGGDVSPQAFVRGEEALGTSFRSASVIGTSFGPGKHDGVGAVRRLAFNDNCTCFRYTSGPQRI
jgi:hypothetical protein